MTWKLTDNLLFYQHQHFEFKGSLIIVEFENFLIKKVKKDYLSKKIEINNINKHIRKLAKDNDIVIIHNYINISKTTIDMIKSSLEEYIERTNLIILAIFPLLPDKLSKPFTGSYLLLKSYYKNIGKVNINNIKIYNDKFYHNNCFLMDNNITFEDINPETCEPRIIDIKTFDKKSVLSVLPIEERQSFIDNLSYKNVNWIKKLSGNNCIIIYGPPRSGKTTIANQIYRIWKQTELNNTGEIVIVDGTYKKNIKDVDKYLKERISVIIDCNLYNDKLREVFIEIAKKHDATVIILEINIPIELAYLFNKVSVQQNNTKMLTDKEFILYKGLSQRDESAILYTPNINKTQELMEFMY